MENKERKSRTYSRLGILVPLAAALLIGCGGGSDGGGGGPGPSDPVLPLPLDPFAPAVVSMSPANGATGVSVDTPITVSFSEAVTNVTPATFRLSAGATQVPAIVVADNGASVTFILAAPLAAATTYAVTVTTGVTDIAGNHLAADYTWTFTTGVDATPPAVVFTYPASKATAVPTTAKMTATFSEPVTNVTSETFLLTTAHDGAFVPGEVKFDGRTATFTPSEPLFYFEYRGFDYYGPFGMVYRAVVTTGVTDLSGNHLAVDYSWTFTTDAYLEATPPTVVSVTPANGSMGVSVGTFITVTFSEAVTNANAATFIVSANGVPVPGQVTMDGSNACFTPSAPLAIGTTFTAIVTTGVRDLAGNSLATDHTWTFTTGQVADATPPTVTATAPADRANGVSTRTAVTATFSEPVTNVTDITFLLTADGAPVPGTVTLSGPVATFTPSTPLTYGPTYRATVTTGVTDLSGNALAVNYSWSFTAVIWYWATPPTPRILETGSDNAFSPQVAMGFLETIVWVQSDNTADSIWAASASIGPSEPFPMPTLIETGGGAASSPQVAVNANGDAVVVWVQSDGTTESVWSNRYGGYPSMSGWGTATLIETGADNASSPQVAIDNNGNAVAVWVQPDRHADSIWANRYDPAIGWGTAAPIENGNGKAVSPQVASDGDGNITAVWVQADGKDDRIWTNRYLSGAGWGTASPIDTNAGQASLPQVAAGKSGDAIVVWVQSDGATNNVWANHYVPGNGWETAILIETGSDNAWSPQVAIDNNGRAVAVWVQSDGIADSIWSNRYVPGTGWGTASVIEDQNGPASSPQVAMDEAMDVDGYAIVVWVQSGGTVDRIWSNRYLPTTGWGMPTPIDSGTGWASAPQVATLNYNHTVVWQEWDGTRYNIWARYDIRPIGGGCSVAGTRGGWKVAVGVYGPLLLVLAGLALRRCHRGRRMAGGDGG